MSSIIRYISSKQQLIEAVEALLKNNPVSEIMIAGTWTKILYENVVELIIDKQCCSYCKIIIPKLLFKGDISLPLLRKVCKAGGEVRVNNAVTNNLLLIGGYAFILSFSSRLTVLICLALPLNVQL